jgi:hypothetical protein
MYVKKFYTNQNRFLIVMDDPGHYESYIISVVYKIQQFNFESNLVVTRKVIMGIPPGLRSKLLFKNLLRY